jgi:hypothetical protein
MIFYYTFLLISFFAILEVLKIKLFNKRIIYGFFIVYLILFAGFRPGVGYDFDSYLLIFNNFSILSFAVGNIELGFLSLMFLSKELSDDFNIFLLLVATISIIVKFQVIKKYSPYLFISVLLYFTQEFLARDFGNIRQGLAIAFTAYSVQYAYERELFKFLILLFIATLFHTTAIVFIIIYFVHGVKLSHIFIFISIFLAFVFGQILDTNNIVYILSLINNEYILTKLSDYTSQTDYSSALGITPGLFQRILIFSIFVLYERVFIKQTVYYYLIRNISFIGILFFLFFNSFEIVAARGSYYFRFFDVIIIAFIVNMIKDINYKIIATILIILYSFQGIYRELSRHGVYFPYEIFN